LLDALDRGVQDSSPLAVPPFSSHPTIDAALTPPEELKEREGEILVALLLLGAVSKRNRVSRRKAARKADPEANESTYYRHIASLAKRELVRSEKGPLGGIWLTPNGKTVAQSLQGNTHQ
jgi:hypothetical protein